MLIINMRNIKTAFLFSFTLFIFTSCEDSTSKSETGDINISFNFPSKSTNQPLTTITPVVAKKIPKEQNVQIVISDQINSFQD